MINAKELTQEMADSFSGDLFNKEIAKLEEMFDIAIINNAQIIIDKNKFSFTVHDSENRHKNSLKYIIDKYKEAGWAVNVSRSWSALFVDIIMERQ